MHLINKDLKIRNLEIKMQVLLADIEKSPHSDKPSLIRQYNQLDKQYQSYMGYRFSPIIARGVYDG